MMVRITRRTRGIGTAFVFASTLSCSDDSAPGANTRDGGSPEESHSSSSEEEGGTGRDSTSDESSTSHSASDATNTQGIASSNDRDGGESGSDDESSGWTTGAASLPDGSNSETSELDAGMGSDEGTSAADSGARPPPELTGNVGLEQLPESGAVGFIITGDRVSYYRLPNAESTSINHLSPDGYTAYGWFRDASGSEQGFTLDLESNTFTALEIPGTRFVIVRGGYEHRVVGKLADNAGTPEDPDDDVRKGFILDTESGELSTFTRPGFTDIGFSSLNALGHVTGFNDFGAQGFVMVDGQYIDLDAPDAYRLFPFQINDAGRFVGFWGATEDNWFDGTVNPSFVGRVSGTNYTVERYEFPGYSGTGLAGINNDGTIAGIAHRTPETYPIVFSAASTAALPKVYPLPTRFEPFVTGIDERGWIYGQIFLHEEIVPSSDPEAEAVASSVEDIRAEVRVINGPAHSGSVASVIHSAYHDLDSPVQNLQSLTETLLTSAADREQNRQTIHTTLVNEIWIEARKVEHAAQGMKQDLDESEVGDTADGQDVYSALAAIQTLLGSLRERVREMADSFQEVPAVEWSGLGGPLNPTQLASGNVLVALATDDRVVELDESGATSWSYPVDYPTDAVRLENGNTLIASRDEGRVFELDGSETVVWEYAAPAVYGVERLSNGNTLLSVQGDPARIIEVTPSGDVAWTYGAGSPELLAPSATRLSNGNTLIGDNMGYHLGYATLFEVNSEQEVVWELAEGLYGIYGASRLESGNSLINDQGNGRIIEVTPTGNLVWSYGALNTPGGFHAVGESLWIAVFGENRLLRIDR